MNGYHLSIDSVAMTMKLTSRLLITPILLALACSSCAQEDSTTENKAALPKMAPAAKPGAKAAKEENQVRLDDNGNLLIFTSQGNGSLKGSLVSMTDGDSDVRYQRIMTMLNALPIDKAFVAKVGERLKVNRRLKQDSFVLPLVDEKGDAHNFEYISNTEQQMYTLNYRFEKAA